VIRQVVGLRDASHQPIPVPVAAPGKRLETADCFRYCEAFTRAHHENFPVASRFLPERLRPHVCALYAFVRMADDFADEPQYAGHRAEELDRWEDLLIRCFHGEAEHPVFVALSDTIQRYDLPIAPFSDLISAFRMDLRVKRFATWSDLNAYIALAAQPIGRLLLYIYGVRDANAHRHADELATALALTAFWQDLQRDLARDRLYLPIEDLRHFGVTEEDLRARRQSKALEQLVRYECVRTRAVYERARPIVDLVGDDLGVEIALCWFGGSRALEKIEGRADDVFGGRARLNAADKAWVVARSLRRRGVGLLRR
jgi:hydroxysqualene synthase